MHYEHYWLKLKSLESDRSFHLLPCDGLAIGYRYIFQEEAVAQNHISRLGLPVGETLLYETEGSKQKAATNKKVKSSMS